MCNHEFMKVNDVRVCTKCGLTFTDSNKVIFDRKLPNYGRKKRGKKKNAKKTN